jgi:hypothetical protein
MSERFDQLLGRRKRISVENAVRASRVAVDQVYVARNRSLTAGNV